MCGIGGIFNTSFSDDQWRTSLEKMNRTLHHRGPDDQGIWWSSDLRGGVCHTRLSIQDLSQHGHQPMHSASGRYVVAFNGEIYNFKNLREELEKQGSSFQGGSDTEVLLAAIEAWGLDSTLDKIVGMYAFALIDQSKRALTLVRDRAGEKPIYYGWANSRFLFGSELKALRSVHPDGFELNQESIYSYTQLGYVPSPYSIYKNIFKLPAGSYLTLRLDELSSLNAQPISQYYWNPRILLSQKKSLDLSFQAASRRIESQLEEIISRQMIADVPYGAFLSGGVDSSLVTALMQKQSSQKIKTFTVGFENQEYDESPYAREVSQILGTDHHELTLSEQDVLDSIPKIPHIYDEPFSDPSQVPTYLVSRFAREHVTVCLTGDGADEVFGGYNRHVYAEQYWNRIRYLPARFRKTVAQFGLSFMGERAERLFLKFNAALPSSARVRYPAQKVEKLLRMFLVSSAQELYPLLIQMPDQQWALHQQGHCRLSEAFSNDLNALSTVEQMMFCDFIEYLCDDILTKVDRATMSVSLESRAPFLDHHLVEHAWELPESFKISEGKGKYILRDILSRHVPDRVMNRKKTGFTMPMGEWLKGGLSSWAGDILSSSQAKRSDLLNEDVIEKMWDEHRSGKRNWENQVWNVLMLKSWLLEETQSSYEAISSRKE